MARVRPTRFVQGRAAPGRFRLADLHHTPVVPPHDRLRTRTGEEAVHERAKRAWPERPGRRPRADDMSEPVLERSVLERKERDELQTIAKALGAKPPARAKNCLLYTSPSPRDS